MTTPLSDLLPYVTPYAAGVSDPVALHAIRQATDQLCRETAIVQERQEMQLLLGTDVIVGDFYTDHYDGITVNGLLRFPFAENGSANQYVVTAPAGMRPYEPQSVWVRDQLDAGTRALTPSTPRQFDYCPEVFDDDNFGTPRYYTRMPSEYLRIVPILNTNAPAKFTTRLSFTILDDTTEVPDLLYENWRNTIGALSLYMLYNMPDQSYTSEKKAATEWNKYRAGRSKARILIENGRTRALVAPRPNFWA
jgi:hypothetical protein